jgi:ABC-type antimicrobial peptide transport system permease subunit
VPQFSDLPSNAVFCRALCRQGLGIFRTKSALAVHLTVMQREREIGVRIALGATARNIAQIVSARVFAMVLLGAAVGLTLGLASEPFVASLLFGVKGAEMSMMTFACGGIAVGGGYRSGSGGDAGDSDRSGGDA